MYFVVAYAYSGLSPVRARPWRAYQKDHWPFLDMPVVLYLQYLLFQFQCTGVQLIIFAFLGNEGVMISSLDYLAVFKDYDCIGVTDC